MRRLAGQKDAKFRKASVKSQAALAIAEAERHEQAENFEEAVENLEAAMQQLSDGKLEASPEYARCLELSAKIADAEGRNQDSLRFLSESLQLEQALGRLDSTEIASRSKQLVQAHVKDGNLAAASGMLENTLLLCEKKFGPDHAEVADLLADLAAVQQAGNLSPGGARKPGAGFADP
jgi:hypothetical protein